MHRRRRDAGLNSNRSATEHIERCGRSIPLARYLPPGGLFFVYCLYSDGGPNRRLRVVVGEFNVFVRVIEDRRRPALDEEALIGLEDHLVALVEHQELTLQEPAVRARGLALRRHADPGVDRVADLHRPGEVQLVEAEEGDQRVVVEVEPEQQARGYRPAA